ncbi:MAG: glycosyl hydrolase family 18 protein [Actinomycetota bacterium]|nr:glycosyl hydrolase family 18 protein [Actinomycetota bacterium]
MGLFETRASRVATLRSAVLAVVIGALVVGPLATAPPAAADDPARSAVVTGWLPSWATSSALAGIEANSDLVGEASPFWYRARASGGSVSISNSVGSETMSSVLASLRERGIAVIPSVADGSGRLAMATVLKDKSDRRAHVDQLVDLVMSNGYDGIELDYEKFAFTDGTSTWAATRPAWVAFVTELGAALHANGKKLALAVPPMYNGTYAVGAGYWVYDYAGVAPSVDSLRIMTYDFSVSRPGPIAPLSFLHRTLSYAVTAFPAERIRMGVPAYGRLWTARNADGSPAISGKCPAGQPPSTMSFTTNTALDTLQAKAGATPSLRYDETTAEMVATFSKTYSGETSAGKKTSCTVDHEAWWVDSRGVAARLPLVTQYGLEGIAVWQLGGVDANSWDAMRSFATGVPIAAPAPLAGPDPVPAVTPVVKAKPSTLQPKRGAKVKVRVKVSPKKKKVRVKRQMRINGSWRTVAKKRTGAKGRTTFTIKWPRKRTSLTYRIKTNKRGTLGPGKSPRFTITTRR